MKMNELLKITTNLIILLSRLTNLLSYNSSLLYIYYNKLPSNKKKSYNSLIEYM